MKILENGSLILLCTIILTFFQTKSNAQINDVQLYTFAHSLIDHRPPAIPTPSDETTVLHWVYDIAQTSGKSFSTTGQYGQLNNHLDNLPPNSNLGYDQVPNSWDENSSSFADASLNTILLTPANFIQYSPPEDPDPSDPAGRTVLELTEGLFDWLNNEQSNLKYYIYGNWPEMDLQNAFPPSLPSQVEIDDYHSQTIGDTGSFANWWLEYQDQMILSRPQLNMRLIPVGSIISKVLRDVLPNQIPFDELYEDSAPHGRANIYFLAGMICYMAFYEENIPDTYLPSNIINQEIISNLDTIRDFIWNELNEFNFPNGESRVFYSTLVNVEQSIAVENFSFYPNPVEGIITVSSPSLGSYMIELINAEGLVYRSHELLSELEQIEVKDLPRGIYFLQVRSEKGKAVMTKKFVKQ